MFFSFQLLPYCEKSYYISILFPSATCPFCQKCSKELLKEFIANYSKITIAPTFCFCLALSFFLDQQIWFLVLFEKLSTFKTGEPWLLHVNPCFKYLVKCWLQISPKLRLKNRTIDMIFVKTGKRSKKMNHTFRWGWPLNFKFHVVNICLAYNISYSGQYYDWEKQVTRQPSFL